MPTRPGLLLVPSLLAFLAAVAAAAVPPQGQLWIVDKAGGGDFTEIQAAVDFASDGDTIRVVPETLPGVTYSDVVIDGKGLVLLGENPQPSRGA